MKRNGSKNRRGALTFEWLIIITLLVIGMIGGLGALRNSICKTCDVIPEQTSKINTGFKDIIDPTNP